MDTEVAVFGYISVGAFVAAGVLLWKTLNSSSRNRPKKAVVGMFVFVGAACSVLWAAFSVPISADSEEYMSHVVVVRVEGDVAIRSRFSEGLAVAENRDKLLGYIDTQGRVVIEPRFSSALPFSEGLAAVGLAGEFGYIDRNGNRQVANKFAAADSFKDGIARVAVQDGAEILYGFISTQGEFLVEPEFAFARDFSEGLAAVKVDDKWGFVDQTGRLVVRPIYDHANTFSDGLAAVRVGHGNDKRTGFIDRDGKAVLPIHHSVSFFPFSEGLAGFVQPRNMKEIVRRVGGATARRTNYEGPRLGFIDKQGNVVINARYPAMTYFDKNVEMLTIMCCKRAYEGTFADGLSVVPHEYEWFKRFGAIGTDGDYVIAPEFTRLSPFSGDLAKAESFGWGYGYIDRNGEYIIPPRYLSAHDLVDGAAGVRTEDGWHVLSVGKPKPASR